jgi:peptide/nickel transport system permease protein
MLAYVIRRFIQSLIVLLIVMLFTFTLPYFQTGGIYAPAFAVLGVHANARTVLEWGAQNGMNHPYVVRFWNYLVQVFGHFNLGHSYKLNLSVWNIISLYVPRTLWLALSALIFTVLIGVPLGIYQASKRNTSVDYTATGVAFVLYAMPLFLLCLLALQAFSFSWPHLPASPPNGVAPWPVSRWSRSRHSADSCAEPFSRCWCRTTSAPRERRVAAPKGFCFDTPCEMP